MSRKYFGTDGVRGLVGQFPITPDFALRLGYAAGKVLARSGTNKVLIGKDTRVSGYMFESALQAGFSAAGVSVALLGPMPTPAVAYLTRTFRAEAGVVISASHNPFHDNGIKFFSADGVKLPDEVELEIERELDQPMGCVASEVLGKASRVNDAAGRYIEYCKSAFSSELSLAGLKIVVDCANGATYHIAPNVLRELGAEIIVIGDKPNGVNINDNCGATSLGQLQARVLEEKADLGFALDGDGDRIMLVDHTGTVVDGDEILFILARDALRQGKMKGGVVGTQMANLGLELALQSLGIPFARSKVGDRYVVEMLKEKGWLIGGENSGHILNLEYATTGDGIVAGLQVLAAMRRADMSLFELRRGMSKFPQVLVNIRYSLKDGGNGDPLSSDEVQAAVEQAETEMGGRGRVLLRKSGTEPLLRVMVEGENEAIVTELAERIAGVVKAQDVAKAA